MRKHKVLLFLKTVNSVNGLTRGAPAFLSLSLSVSGSSAACLLLLLWTRGYALYMAEFVYE